MLVLLPDRLNSPNHFLRQAASEHVAGSLSRVSIHWMIKTQDRQSTWPLTKVPQQP